MTQEDLKVNDKRMFTADGELREEFRHLEDAESAAEPSAERAEAAEAAEAPASTAAEQGPIVGESPAEAPVETPFEAPPAVDEAAAAEPSPSPPLGEPEAAVEAAMPPPSGEVSILDLVGLLAEHTALYLGQATLPDGKSVQDLRAAQLHLDLLDVLRAKTAGNLTEEEASVLEDILYRLRMIFVEKQRQE